MEVDVSWLEPETKPAKTATKPTAKRTSRPPMERKETMEVRLEWLEPPAEPEPAKRTRSSRPPQRKASTANAPAAAKRKPGPPTLPPTKAVKPKRVAPPPLPREEPED
jgi:hypothetical protein